MTAEEPAEAPGKTLRNQPPSSGPFRSVPFRSVRPSVVLFRRPGPRGECSWAGKFGGLEGPRAVLSICTLPETRPCTESGTHRGGWGGSRKSRCAPRGRESCRKSSQKHLFSTLPWAPRFRGTVPNPNNKLCSLRPHTGFHKCATCKQIDHQHNANVPALVT